MNSIWSRRLVCFCFFVFLGFFCLSYFLLRSDVKYMGNIWQALIKYILYTFIEKLHSKFYSTPLQNTLVEKVQGWSQQFCLSYQNKKLGNLYRRQCLIIEKTFMIYRRLVFSLAVIWILHCFYLGSSKWSSIWKTKQTNKKINLVKHIILSNLI